MNSRSHEQIIASELGLRQAQIQAAVRLFDDGNTLPFIARYRKEATDGLDEDALAHIASKLEHLRTLDKRRDAIRASIEEQGHLTGDLRIRLLQAETLTALEDLYQPFKPKRNTRASIARQNGLQGLADLILSQPMTRQAIEDIARPFLNENVPTIEDALSGARDIVAETISDHAEIRGQVRDKALRWGMLHSEKTKDASDEKEVYRIYYAFEARVDRLQAYQILAINRGEMEKVLKVKVSVAPRDWEGVILSIFRSERRSPLADQLTLAVEDSAQRLLLPTIERDVRRILTEKAESHAIRVFAANLKGLLNQPPLSNHTILGIDPAYRTGCKIAIIAATGKIIETGVIYPHEPQRQWERSKATLATLIQQHGVTLIAIGNGTASRETEQLVADVTRTLENTKYLIVNEAGASVYSASPQARAEMPDLDVTLRGAVSIARRVHDPLAELVKIDPKSIGVGLYQHDVNQQQLSTALDDVVKMVVNRVGVDVNTASPSLLMYVAGIGPKLAERIIAYRDEYGIIRNRKQLRAVSGLGPKVFEQSAGFLRVRGGDNPLDTSAIHPESYAIAEQVLKRAGVTMHASLEEREAALNALKPSLNDLAAELNTGIPTLIDIFEQLVRPGRDPRQDLPAPLLRSDVLSMDDLSTGMILSGTVRNIVDFGVFIDIGVKQDGLLHRSQIPRHLTLSVGAVLDVTILSVDMDRNRIGLGIPGNSG